MVVTTRTHAERIYEVVYTVNGEIGPSKSQLTLTDGSIENIRRVLNQHLGRAGAVKDITCIVEVSDARR